MTPERITPEFLAALKRSIEAGRRTTGLTGLALIAEIEIRYAELEALRSRAERAEAESERLRTIARGAWRFWAHVTLGHPIPEALRTVHFTMPRALFMEFDAIFRKAQPDDESNIDPVPPQLGQPRLSGEDAEPDEQVVETEPPTRQAMQRISDPGLDPRSTKHYYRSKPAAEGQAGGRGDG